MSAEIVNEDAPNKMAVHYSSATVEWSTPQDYFDKVNAEFNFTTDVCATPENAKCARFFTKEDDGLKQTWLGSCWINPPYGRGIGAWMRKAFESAQGGGNCCVPHPSPHRYCVVSGLRAKGGGPLYPGSAEIWRTQECGALPVRAGGVQTGDKRRPHNE